MYFASLVASVVGVIIALSPRAFSEEGEVDYYLS